MLFNSFKNKCFGRIVWVFLLFISMSIPLSASVVVRNIPLQNPYFVGREDFLQLISKKLMTDSEKMVVITGPHGFGKTQLVKRYCARSLDQYDIIWWFKESEFLDQQFQNFVLALDDAYQLNLKGKLSAIGHSQLVNIVQDVIRRKKLKCLFVFDELCFLKDIQIYGALIREPSVHAIVTTRNTNFSVAPLILPPFQRQESLTYIHQFFPQETRQDVEELAERLNNHHFSLAVAVNYIKNCPGMTIAFYLQKHNTVQGISREKKQEAAQRFGSPLGTAKDGYVKNFLQAIQMNLVEFKKVSPTAYRLVCFLSLLHHTSLTADDVEWWLKHTKSQEDVLAIIQLMNRYFWTDQLVVKGKPQMHMHELVQKSIRSLVPNDEKIDHIEEVVKRLDETFHQRSDLVVASLMKDNTPLLHLLNLSEEAQFIDYHSPRLTALRVRGLDVLIGHLRNYEKGDYEKTNFIIDCLQKDLDRGIHLNKEDEILYNTNLFLLSMSSPSDHDNGLESAFKALTLIEEEPGLYEEKIRLYSNLIQYHALAGLLEEGKHYIQKGRDIFCSSQSDAYNALFVYAVMMFLLEEGEIDKTISHIQEHQALLDRQEFYPYLRFYSLSLLGEALIKKGKIEEAQKVLSTAEKMAREFYDNETVNFFGYLCVLKGYAQSLLGDHQQAQELIQRSIQIYDVTYKGSDKHKNQAFAHFVLGKNYYLDGQLDAAKKELLYSEEIYQKVQKCQRTSDVSELYKTLIQVGADLKNEELIRKFLKKQVDTFGLRHPRTREIYAYLDEKGIVVVL